MKKLLALSLFLLAVLLSLPACDNSSDPAGTTEPGTTAPETEIIENIIPVEVPYTYSITDGKVTLLRYTGEDENVVIPEKVGEYPVVCIGKFAFAENPNLKSVEIPGTLPETGEFAFYHCENLTTVTLGEGIAAISYGSFNECVSLKGVVLPASCTVISYAAFKGCMSLDAIDLSHVTKIEDAAFNHSGLVNLVVPATVTTFEEQIFMDCPNLVKVEWYAPGNIREKTFAYCYALKDVYLAEGVSRIYDDCFRRCTALETITFPSSVIRYYAHAMYGCTSLKSITFRNPGIDRFYEMAFHYLPSLTDIYFAGTQEQWNAMDKGTNNEGLTLDSVTVHFGA